MMRALLAAALATLPLAAPAAAFTQAEIERCNAMAATFKVKRAEIADLQERRDALAVAAETAGAEWEAAEELRHFSDDQAAEADAARAEWNAAKQAVMRAEMALQAKVQQYNADQAQFNAACARGEG